ncbi:MAG: hypothetical protein HYS81_00785 [Candidatus Aenigmatarchaeota archaeon]|nr:MAG: hypothetical protein HYS81_00785 [Candidatus Aenigmarchaeota archaeon]
MGLFNIFGRKPSSKGIEKETDIDSCVESFRENEREFHENLEKASRAWEPKEIRRGFISKAKRCLTWLNTYDTLLRKVLFTATPSQKTLINEIGDTTEDCRKLLERRTREVESSK